MATTGGLASSFAEWETMDEHSHNFDPNETGGATETPTASLLLRAPEAAASCAVSTRTWRSWDAAGRIPQPVRIGRSTLWRLDELRAWVAAGCPRRKEWEDLQS